MGAVDTTYTFTATDTITSTKMNNIIDQTTLTSDAIIGTTLEVASGKLKVRSANITSNELATNAVTTTAITDLNVTTAKIADANVTTAKIADANVTTAKIADANVTTAKIADASITATKLNAAQTGDAPIFGCRAWVNFDAQSNTDISGTYSRPSSTTVTVTATSHGLIAGNLIFIDFTVGTGTAPFDGMYEVASVTDSNTFTVTSSVSVASTGTAVLKRKTIRGSGNISCVSAAGPISVIPPTSNNTVTNGYYIANFSTAMPSSNFAILGTCNEFGSGTAASGNDIFSGFPYNEKSAVISTINIANTPIDALYNSVSIIV